jgi:hypothetical protein
MRRESNEIQSAIALREFVNHMKVIEFNVPVNEQVGKAIQAIFTHRRAEIGFNVLE